MNKLPNCLWRNLRKEFPGYYRKQLDGVKSRRWRYAVSVYDHWLTAEEYDKENASYDEVKDKYYQSLLLSYLEHCFSIDTVFSLPLNRRYGCRFHSFTSLGDFMNYIRKSFDGYVSYFVLREMGAVGFFDCFDYTIYFETYYVDSREKLLSSIADVDLHLLERQVRVEQVAGGDATR